MLIHIGPFYLYYTSDVCMCGGESLEVVKFDIGIYNVYIQLSWTELFLLK